MEQLLQAGVEAAKQGRPKDAFAWICRAAKLHPDRYEPHYYLGCMLAKDRQHENAIVCFNRALQVKPFDLEVTKALIVSLRRTGKFARAEAEARNWSKMLPDDAGAHAALAHIFMEQYRFEEALTEAKIAAAADPDNVDAIVLVAGILARLGRCQEAGSELLRARTRAPHRADVYLHLGNKLKVEGRVENARAAFEQALELDPANATALLELAELTHFSAADPLLARMEELSAREATAPQPARLHFALGKAYDNIGQTDSAFRHFAIANAREHANNGYDERATLNAIARIMEVVSPAFIEQLRGNGNPSRIPIFIVGMPRSGTTLVEQILASHPAVAAGGELHHFHQSVEDVLSSKLRARAFPDGLCDLLPQDVIAIGARYLSRIQPAARGHSHVTDKLPANALLVGLIHAALPNCKIICCERDPVDTCLSCFMTSFDQRVPYSTDLSALGRYYRAHAKLMDHWRGMLPSGTIMDIRYEDVVADTECQARRLLSFCGLHWDTRCVLFHKTERPVNTASALQVREPIYGSSVGRGRRYAAYLGPLRSALGEQLR